jgi:hypothetical protein
VKEDFKGGLYREAMLNSKEETTHGAISIRVRRGFWPGVHGSRL